MLWRFDQFRFWNIQRFPPQITAEHQPKGGYVSASARQHLNTSPSLKFSNDFSDCPDPPTLVSLNHDHQNKSANQGLIPC
jgi:hypothetical protein